MNVFASHPILRRWLAAAAVALVFGSAGAGAARAGGVVLHRLEVLRPQECNGDELSLEAQADRGGRNGLVWRANLGRGTGFVPLNINVPFCREAWVTLKEHDKRFLGLGRKSKSLGTIYIDLRPGVWWQDFTLNGAYYRLHYQVYP
jgi:hypothetical protein